MKTLLWTLLIALQSPLIQAFTLNNNVSAHFAQDEVTVNVSAAANACSNIGLTKDDLLSLISEAVDRFWNDVPTSRLRLKAGGEVEVSANFETGKLCEQVIFGDVCDGPASDIPKVSDNIVVACNSNSEYAGILGIALPNNIDGEIIKGSAVLIYSGTNSGFGSKSRDEQISIIAHELGHAIGLGHSPADAALMYYQSMANRMYLSRDDIKGVTYLYPKEEKLGGVVGCGSLALLDKIDPPSGPWTGGVVSIFFWMVIGLSMGKLLKMRPKARQS